MKIGLLIGRFQPFNLGHLSAVRQALSQCDFLIIGIGSSQYSGTEDNPFTAEERRIIIEKTLEGEGIPKDRYGIIFIPDIHNNEKWPDHVKAFAPDFEVLFVGNDGIVKRLFEQLSPEKKIIPVKNEIPLSGTRVRKKMEQGEDWHMDVSPYAVDDLESFSHPKGPTLSTDRPS